MLAKLLKFEFKALSIYLFPLYSIVLLFTLVFSLIYNTSFIHSFLSDNFYSMSRVILIVLYVAIIVAMEIITFIVTAKRMYNNLLGDDGYLMNTIPVKASNNILCKTISAVIWNIIAGIIFCVSIAAIMCSNLSFQEIFSSISVILQKIVEAKNILQGDFYIYFLEVFIYVLLSEIAGTLIIYASVCIGHLFSRKIIGSIGGFILCQAIMLFLSAAIDYFIFGRTNFNNNNAITSISDLNNTFYYHGILIANNLLYIFIIVSCFCTSKYIIEHKLNLE